MSALDLFASAMGTFILQTVVLFPYYLKNVEIVERMSALRQQLEQSQAALRQIQQALEDKTIQHQQCETERSQQQQRNRQLEQEVRDCQEKLK